MRKVILFLSCLVFGITINNASASINSTITTVQRHNIDNTTTGLTLYTVDGGLDMKGRSTNYYQNQDLIVANSPHATGNFNFGLYWYDQSSDRCSAFAKWKLPVKIENDLFVLPPTPDYPVDNVQQYRIDNFTVGWIDVRCRALKITHFIVYAEKNGNLGYTFRAYAVFDQ